MWLSHRPLAPTLLSPTMGKLIIRIIADELSHSRFYNLAIFFLYMYVYLLQEKHLLKLYPCVILRIIFQTFMIKIRSSILSHFKFPNYIRHFVREFTFIGCAVSNGTLEIVFTQPFDKKSVLESSPISCFFIKGPL